MTSISEKIEQQRIFFNTNNTKDITFRIEQLKKLKSLLKENEHRLYEAIYDDFGKSEFETYISELSLIYHETDKFIKNIKKWSKRKRVNSGLAHFPSKSYIIPEPLGTVLVIGAWNYPYQLSLVPAVSAIAAGNTVIIKPSELPINTSKIMAELINSSFDENYFHVIEGGIPETTELLNHRFDKIFFTGSIPVGKIIYQAAAKHLTPVTLELGGKSPAFICKDCNLEISAKRLAWAKFLNAGQTCVAPDYLLVDKSIKQKFIGLLKKELENYPKTFDQLPDHYMQLINEANFDRLTQLINPEKVVFGGESDRENRFLGPTILDNITFDDDVMQDEIFGPILPIVEFSDLNEAIKCVKNRPKPLSCYIYSNSTQTINKILNEVSFGGGAVNDSVIQLTNSNLPFGGVGHSGIGSYHGKTGFDVFSHFKSILHKPFWWEPNLKYAPYSKKKLNFLKYLLE